MVLGKARVGRGSLKPMWQQNFLAETMKSHREMDEKNLSHQNLGPYEGQEVKFALIWKSSCNLELWYVVASLHTTDTETYKVNVTHKVEVPTWAEYLKPVCGLES